MCSISYSRYKVHTLCLCERTYVEAVPICYVHVCTVTCTNMSIGCCTYIPSQIEISRVNYTGTLESSQQSQVLVLVNQLDQNFTKGENHTVRVFVTNSIGTSPPLSTLLRVPCESLISCTYHNQLLTSEPFLLTTIPASPTSDQ